MMSIVMGGERAEAMVRMTSGPNRPNGGPVW